jgi:hypothetical protein
MVPAHAAVVPLGVSCLTQISEAGGDDLTGTELGLLVLWGFGTFRNAELRAVDAKLASNSRVTWQCLALCRKHRPRRVQCYGYHLAIEAPPNKFQIGEVSDI